MRDIYLFFHPFNLSNLKTNIIKHFLFDKLSIHVSENRFFRTTGEGRCKKRSGVKLVISRMSEEWR